MLGGVDWEISQVHSITDGDTLRLWRRKTENLDDYTAHTIFDRLDVFPRGISVRLINLDTPERTDPIPWRAAREDVMHWLLSVPQFTAPRVETWAHGGFDRFLGDVYYIDGAGVRQGLSEWMLRYGNGGEGWDPYVRGM